MEADIGVDPETATQIVRTLGENQIDQARKILNNVLKGSVLVTLDHLKQLKNQTSGFLRDITNDAKKEEALETIRQNHRTLDAEWETFKVELNDIVKKGTIKKEIEKLRAILNDKATKDYIQVLTESAKKHEQAMQVYLIYSEDEREIRDNILKIINDIDSNKFDISQNEEGVINKITAINDVLKDKESYVEQNKKLQEKIATEDTPADEKEKLSKEFVSNEALIKSIEDDLKTRNDEIARINEATLILKRKLEENQKSLSDLGASSEYASKFVKALEEKEKYADDVARFEELALIKGKTESLEKANNRGFMIPEITRFLKQLTNEETQYTYAIWKQVLTPFTQESDVEKSKPIIDIPDIKILHTEVNEELAKIKDKYANFDRKGLQNQLSSLMRQINNAKLRESKDIDKILSDAKEMIKEAISNDVAGNLSTNILKVRTIEGLITALSGYLDTSVTDLAKDLFADETLKEMNKEIEDEAKKLDTLTNLKDKARCIRNIAFAIPIFKRAITARILDLLQDRSKYEWYNPVKDLIVVDFWDINLNNEKVDVILEVNPTEIALGGQSFLLRDGILKNYFMTKLAYDFSKDSEHLKKYWRLKKRFNVTPKVVVYIFSEVEVRKNNFKIKYNMEEDRAALNEILTKGKKINSESWEKIVMVAQKCTIEVLSHMANVVSDIGFYAFPRESLILDYVLGISLSLLEHKGNSPIYQALYYDIYYLYIYLASKLLHGEGFNKDDKDTLEYLPIFIQRQIKAFNELHKENQPDLTEGLNLMLNLDFMDEIIDELESYVTQPQQFEKQKDFEMLNKFANQENRLDIHRGYLLEPETCYIEWKEVMNLQGGLGQVPDTASYENSMFGFKIIDHREFTDTLKLNFKFDKNVRQYFHIITNTAYKKTHTYRKSTRFNRGLRAYMLTINGVSYPEIPMTGEADSSDETNIFFKELQKCVRTGGSKINLGNFALDSSTTMYLTRKLYGETAGKMFKFDSDTNLRYVFKFGYDDEMLGKCVIGISLDSVKDKIIGIVDDQDYNVDIEFVCLPEDTAAFGEYEITTLVGTTSTIKVNEMGELVDSRGEYNMLVV